MLRASITEGEKTVLHVATEAKQTAFVEELVNLMEPEDLILQDIKHNTAFCFAAAAGNIQIAKIMLTKNASLPKIRGCEGLTPLYMAVINDLYDIALKLLEDDKDLAVARDQNHETALHILARKPLASDCRSLGLLKRLFKLRCTIRLRCIVNLIVILPLAENSDSAEAENSDQNDDSIEVLYDLTCYKLDNTNVVDQTCLYHDYHFCHDLYFLFPDYHLFDHHAEAFYHFDEKHSELMAERNK
ncbi:hypothetical protein JRO89_XS06G0232300 [Xanthoceras sorbifolium]|uniref:Uncharacterized protein n=1 Tax=Xanthoceras sorbifolium TaxID=99658 RepID=A0ABQ8HZ94_9ROSI|nr:hypothetical protein JRO89_XS06G0232300 [Xanthoceras sorbifolium]